MCRRASNNSYTNNNNKWSHNFDERPHRRGRFFTAEKISCDTGQARAYFCLPGVLNYPFCSEDRSRDRQCFWMAGQPPKIAPFVGGSGLHLIQGNLNPFESTPKRHLDRFNNNNNNSNHNNNNNNSSSSSSNKSNRHCHGYHYHRHHHRHNDVAAGFRFWSWTQNKSDRGSLPLYWPGLIKCRDFCLEITRCDVVSMHFLKTCNASLSQIFITLVPPVNGHEPSV